MKIAVFYNLDFGGAKRAVYEQVKGLRKLGHVVDVYTTDSITDMLDLRKFSDNYFEFKFNNSLGNVPFVSRIIYDFRTFYFLNKLHKKIAEEIDNGKYDFVLVHPDKFTQAPFILRHLKEKNAYYCQEPLRIVYEYNLKFNSKTNFINNVYEKITRAIRKNIDLKNTRSATFTLASCFHIRERMIEAYGVFPKVNYLGIDEKVFKPLNLKNRNQVFFVGNKEVFNDGYDLAEKAIKLLPKKYKIELKKVSWIKENKKRLSDLELVQQYNQSIAVICPSRLETFGLVPIEAMSCGVPVIATNVSGHRETVDNEKTGFLTDFDPVEIKNKILELIENPKRRNEMGKAGRASIQKNWTWEKRSKELEMLIKSLSK